MSKPIHFKYRWNIKMKNERNHRFKRNSGTATIEFILGLPLLLALLSILFGICSVITNRTDVSLRARNQAFAYRNDYTKQQPESLELPGVKKVSKLYPSQDGFEANSGVLRGESKGKPSGIFGPMKLLPLESNNQVAIFAGTWDYREIEFETKSEHPALVLTKKVKDFWPELDASVFKSLGGFGSPSGRKPNFESMSQQAHRLQSDYRRDIDATRRRLADAEQLFEREQDLEGKNQLKSAIKKEKVRLADLKKGLSKLGLGLDLSLGDSQSGFSEELNEKAPR